MIVVSGSGTPYAVIGATYPAGSTCTCTNGTRTVTLKDTSGTGLFKIPYAGTWTVTATNGTDTVSQSVTITVKGQVETVTLAYQLYLFKEGSGVTSGYTINKTATKTFSITDDKIVWSTNTSVGNQVWITPAINLSKYNKVCFDFKCTGQYNSNYSTVTIGVGSDVPTGQNNCGTFVASREVAYSKTRGTYSVDLSAITDATEYYIKLGAYGITGEIYNIWLE